MYISFKMSNQRPWLFRLLPKKHKKQQQTCLCWLRGFHTSKCSCTILYNWYTQLTQDSITQWQVKYVIKAKIDVWVCCIRKWFFLQDSHTPPGTGPVLYQSLNYSERCLGYSFGRDDTFLALLCKLDVMSNSSPRRGLNSTTTSTLPGGSGNPEGNNMASYDLSELINCLCHTSAASNTPGCRVAWVDLQDCQE